jgi:hypothetical protein
MAFVNVTVFCSRLFEVMFKIELPINLLSKHKKNNLLNVIYIIKELVQPKKSLNREFPICKERWRG